MIVLDKLTKKQKLFADWYIKLGNATEAAKKAGYSKKTARVTACENLTKPNILAYIDERSKPQQEEEEKLIAEGEDVLKFLTSVMNGEENDQFDLPPQLNDRIKAAELLGKRYSLFREVKTLKHESNPYENLSEDQLMKLADENE